MATRGVNDAVIVGSGPNGLTAAAVLARAGFGVTVIEAADEIGGGTRSHDRLESGVVHDSCSAVHPLGAASPVLRELDLERHGLRWRHPTVALAHPLDGGRGAVMHRDVDATADRLGADGPAWRAAFGGLAESFETLGHDLLGPLLRVPGHPILLARFGLRAVQSAQRFARRWDGDEARALFAGIAAHAIEPLDRPTTAAVGAILGAAGHRYGWPVAQGGSHAIARALAAEITDHGGEIVTGSRVTSPVDLPPARVVLLDLAPAAAVDLVGDQMPGRTRRALTRWRHGPAAYKIDLVVDGGVPWSFEPARSAGTVHCGGTFDEIARGEAEVNRGVMPGSPFVLVAQQHLADPTRSNGDHHPIWAYTHVPHAYAGDATAAVLDQIERFAPGLRDRIVAIEGRGPAELEADNANYIGGDIATGANTARQVLVRPRLALDPYRVADAVFLCSAATPPGAGVHGMCGYHAARSAMRTLLTS